MPESIRTALLGLIALLLIILACLVVFAYIIRRRGVASRDPDRPRTKARRAQTIEQAPGPTTRSRRPGQSRRPDSIAGPLDGAPLGIGHDFEDPTVCPTCRREFEPGLRFCPHDASVLVPAAQMMDRVHSGPPSQRMCSACHRTYEGSVRFCPHDGTDLVRLTEGAGCDHPQSDESTGVVAKICPRCQGRYDYTATFCGRDGVELEILN